MAENIRVSCKINRFWDIENKEFLGDEVEGNLIAFTTQSDEDDNEKIVPAGIVELDANVALEIEDGTLQSVPVEFITRIIP